MSNNAYNDFKNGVKDDVSGLAWSAFAGIGLFTLIFAIIIVFGVIFYHGNGFSVATKTITGISLAGLVGILLFNRRLGNVIYRYWLAFLIILFIVLVAGFTLIAVYLILKDSFTDFF